MLGEHGTLHYDWGRGAIGYGRDGEAVHRKQVPGARTGTGASCGALSSGGDGGRAAVDLARATGRPRRRGGGLSLGVFWSAGRGAALRVPKPVGAGGGPPRAGFAYHEITPALGAERPG